MAITVVYEESFGYEVLNHMEHNHSWTKLINNLFEEFIALFAPDLYDQINFTYKPKFLRQELDDINKKIRNGLVEQLFKVRLKNNEEKWIFFHIDVPVKSNISLPRQMFQYFCQIFAKYQIEVYTIAVIANPTRNQSKNYYYYSFLGTQLVYIYHLYEYNHSDLSRLQRSANPIANAIAASIFVEKQKQQKRKQTNLNRELKQQIFQRFSNKHDKSTIYLNTLLRFINEICPIDLYGDND